MRYPSVYISALADAAEKHEKDTYDGASTAIGILAHWRLPERIEHVADVVERAEQPIETRLDWIYERLTAYRRLQETREELELVRKDRAALARAYARLAAEYAQDTGERPNAPESEAVRALQRSKTESVFVGLRRVLADLRYKSRG